MKKQPEDKISRSDTYRGTSRDEQAVEKLQKETSPVSPNQVYNDYDYQDTESYEQPVRNSQRGYAPIDTDKPEDTEHH